MTVLTTNSHWILTVFGLGEEGTHFGAVAIDELCAEEVGTAFQLGADVATELLNLVARLTDLDQSSITLPFISGIGNQKLLSYTGKK